MLTGRRPFAGHTPMDVIAQVLTAQPDWSALPPGLPDGAARVLRRCLEKNVQHRLRDAGDARLDLEDRRADAGREVQGSRRTYWWVAALVAVSAIALGIGVVTGRRARETAAPPVVRTSIALPPGQTFQTGRRAVAISPDGQQIVYSLPDGLHIRRLDAFESRPIPGTANAINPAFSPDGRRLAVWTQQGLRNIDPLTGNTTALRSPTTDVGGILGSLSWDEHGLMVTQGTSGVYLFPPDSADGRRIIELAEGEAASSAEMLPGGEYVLMTLLSLSPGRPGSATGQVVVYALQTGSRTTVIESGSDARYVPSGHIVYAAGGALYAMEFDVETLRGRGEPWAVVEGVRATNVINATTHYAVSDTGTLVYVPGQPVSPALALDLVQNDRKGGLRFLHLPAAPYEAPRVSPDGRLVAVSTDDGKEGNIWIHDLSRPSSARKLTVGAGRHRFPVWSPDGRRIVFQSNRGGDAALFSQAADGSDAPLRLTKAEAGAVHTPESWSPSGSDLLFTIAKDGTNRLMRLSLPSGRVEPFADITSSSPTAAAFSPDGKWVAYNLNHVVRQRPCHVRTTLPGHRCDLSDLEQRRRAPSSVVAERPRAVLRARTWPDGGGHGDGRFVLHLLATGDTSAGRSDGSWNVQSQLRHPAGRFWLHRTTGRRGRGVEAGCPAAHPRRDELVRGPEPPTSGPLSPHARSGFCNCRKAVPNTTIRQYRRSAVSLADWHAPTRLT